MKARQIYLDNNATTPLHPKVKEALIDAMENFGNPSSLHAFGRAAKEKVEESRETVASFIGARADEITFTGSGSEANNTVISFFACHSKACNYKTSEPQQIITTAIEHPCILETTKCIAGGGFNVLYLGVDKYGRIDIDELKKSLNKQTRLVSVMMANNEIGTIQNIKEIADIVHKNGSLFHTDAVQALGKIDVNVKELGVDFLTLSAHKIYGPKGIGALYVKKGLPFCPLIRGGHQEKGRRAGTENTLGIIGLGEAIKMRKIEMHDEYNRLMTFRKKLKTGIESSIPDTHFNGHPEKSIPGTLNVSFHGAEGEAILLYLDLEGIAVSTGSACASGSLDPSHVLLATGLDAEYAHGSVRISLGRDTTEEDIDYVLDRLPKVISKIRDMSTIYGGKQ